MTQSSPDELGLLLHEHLASCVEFSEEAWDLEVPVLDAELVGIIVAFLECPPEPISAMGSVIAARAERLRCVERVLPRKSEQRHVRRLLAMGDIIMDRISPH